MLDWFIYADPFTHTIAGLLLLGRLADIISTRLVTPTLRLEANPVMRRLGWRFAWASLLIALLAYYSPAFGIAGAAASFMVAASNLARGWTYRALGEQGTDDFMLRMAAGSRRSTALGFLFGSVALTIFSGIVLMWLSGSPNAPSFWFGAGIVLYGVAIAVHGSLFLRRLFRRARALAPAVP